MTEAENISFEKALEQLEQIVNTLEQGELSLDESLSYFEQGIKLTKICNQKLEQAEKKIEVLTTNDSGELITESIDIEEDK